MAPLIPILVAALSIVCLSEKPRAHGPRDLRNGFEDQPGISIHSQQTWMVRLNAADA